MNKMVRIWLGVTAFAIQCKYQRLEYLLNDFNTIKHIKQFSIDGLLPLNTVESGLWQIWVVVN